MNIVIIEDELMTAEELAEIIGKLGADSRVTAMLDSVSAAVRFFKESPAVDLIFSDIQLGDGLSFEIFRTAPVTAPIIFCTAYDEYALEAIRNNGIEYILKPFTAGAVVDAIEKYRRLQKHFVPVTVDYAQMIRLMIGDRPAVKTASLLVYHKDKIMPVPLHEVALFYIENDQTFMHCLNGRNYAVSETLEELDAIGAGAFFRVNRQFLVNRKAVVDATHYQYRKYVVNLSVPFKEVIVVSKNRATDFLSWLTK